MAKLTLQRLQGSTQGVHVRAEAKSTIRLMVLAVLCIGEWHHGEERAHARIIHAPVAASSGSLRSRTAEVEEDLSRLPLT
ncbi:hypothetical protein H920_00126 [Fukomys damarensis]|uniref:Uncharacterized protein n=1 Tax=Fukomys damarensis TaxID=885580 RepID=A0A091E534_FUKDA|nr:hypothetical protein H920_00126 [Fukomys damarensis]